MKQLVLNRKTVSAATTLATGANLLIGAPVHAQLGDGISATESAAPNNASIEEIIQRVINILLFIVGAGAVIMLIIGGIRYVVSAGDQQAVANAKNTILYAIVGIVVAVLAYAAVQFVFETLSGS